MQYTCAGTFNEIILIMFKMINGAEASTHFRNSADQMYTCGSEIINGTNLHPIILNKYVMKISIYITSRGSHKDRSLHPRTCVRLDLPCGFKLEHNVIIVCLSVIRRSSVFIKPKTVWKSGTGRGHADVSRSRTEDLFLFIILSTWKKSFRCFFNFFIFFQFFFHLDVFRLRTKDLFSSIVLSTKSAASQPAPVCECSTFQMFPAKGRKTSSLPIVPSTKSGYFTPAPLCERSTFPFQPALVCECSTLRCFRLKDQSPLPVHRSISKKVVTSLPAASTKRVNSLPAQSRKSHHFSACSSVRMLHVSMFQANKGPIRPSFHQQKALLLSLLRFVNVPPFKCFRPKERKTSSLPIVSIKPKVVTAP